MKSSRVFLSLPWLLIVALVRLSGVVYSEPASPIALRGISQTATRSAHIRLADLPDTLGVYSNTIPSPRPLPLNTAAAAEQPLLLAASFPGLEDNQLTVPPDTMGAVGPAHLMVTLKTELLIQTREGLPLRKVLISNFWDSVGPFLITRDCSATYCRTQSVFDPRILYDAQSARWLVTALTDARTATASLLLGVSDGPDPLQGWGLYRVDVDRADLNWADYPNLGFNKKWIAVQANIISSAGDVFSRSHLYLFNKTNLYAGRRGDFTLFTEGPGFAAVPAVTLDRDEEGLYVLETGNSNPRSRGELRLSAISGAVGAELFHPGIAFPVAPPWGRVIRNLAPQLGAAQGIDTVDSRMQTVLQRQGSLWAVHTVYLPALDPTHTAIQWWQLTTNGGVLQRGIIEDPCGKEFYAMPSLALNRNSDALIGYSLFSADHYASAAFSFRAAEDPANFMSHHFLLKAGEGPYIKLDENNFNRWGDYSASVVDPANDLDFWTLQEYAAAPQRGLYRWGTWWGQIQLLAAHPRLTATRTPGGLFLISMRTRAGANYVLECASSIPDGPWQTVTNLIGDGSPAIFTNPAPNAAAAFYRVRRSADR